MSNLFGFAHRVNTMEPWKPMGEPGTGHKWLMSYEQAAMLLGCMFDREHSKKLVKIVPAIELKFMETMP